VRAIGNRNARENGSEGTEWNPMRRALHRSCRRKGGFLLELLAGDVTDTVLGARSNGKRKRRTAKPRP
jgi:hypothetical protein